MDFEEAEEQEIKLQTFASGSLTMLKSLTMWIIKTWKVLKEMGIPDHITCLLRNLYADQEAVVRTGHVKIGKGVRQDCILSPCLLYAEYIMRNARLDESQARIKIAGRNTNNLSYADVTTPMAETKEDEPLDEGERGE